MTKFRRQPSPRSKSGRPHPKPQGPARQKQAAPLRKSKKTEDEPNRLAASILNLVKKRPLDAAGIATELDLQPNWKPRLARLLQDMERRGQIVRIRKDRFILPKEADLITGQIQFHMNGSAHILAEAPGAPDVLVRPEHTSTAMHGDTVVARRIPAGARSRVESDRLEGEVIRIVSRATDTIVGTLQRSPKFFYIIPDDPRFPHNLYVIPPAPPLAARAGDKVVARLESWPSRHVNPEGRIVEILGRSGAPGVDMLSIIRRHRLPLEFAPEVLAEASRTPFDIPETELSRRRDLRNALIFTIDPDDAKDFDDAIQVERTPNGWMVGIHIADVSHYVRPGTAMEREAAVRGNSVYLADRVIPMLPEALSNGICSLKPDVERLAFSAFAHIDKSGAVSEVSFAKSVIRSRKRLTYREALAILEQSGPPRDAVSEHVRMAWEVSSLLRKKRFAAGSLDLDFPEIKVRLDEQGRPVRLERIENDISHQLIEELMLLANELVARELKLRKQPALYRIHENPEPDRLEEFREFAASQGISAGDLTQRREIQKILRAILGKPFAGAVKIALLKSLKRARYHHEPLGHYGLSKSDYTHFTSPIRRYSDLIVHRALERQLGLVKKGPDPASLARTAEHISNTERTAAEAEKESVKLKKLEFFQAQAGASKREEFRAVVIDVRNFGFFVELPDFLLTGLVHVSSLGSDFFVHDPARARLTGRQTKKTYSVGDELQVTVERVDTVKQQVDFRPA